MSIGAWVRVDSNREREVENMNMIGAIGGGGLKQCPGSNQFDQMGGLGSILGGGDGKSTEAMGGPKGHGQDPFSDIQDTVEIRGGHTEASGSEPTHEAGGSDKPSGFFSDFFEKAQKEADAMLKSQGKSQEEIDKIKAEAEKRFKEAQQAGSGLK